MQKYKLKDIWLNDKNREFLFCRRVELFVESEEVERIKNNIVSIVWNEHMQSLGTPDITLEKVKSFGQYYFSQFENYYTMDQFGVGYHYQSRFSNGLRAVSITNTVPKLKFIPAKKLKCYEIIKSLYEKLVDMVYKFNLDLYEDCCFTTNIKRFLGKYSNLEEVYYDYSKELVETYMNQEYPVHTDFLELVDKEVILYGAKEDIKGLLRKYDII